MADSTGFFVWYELMTPDMAAAKRFYGNVVGWATEDVPGMVYSLAKVDDVRVAGLMELPKEAGEAGMKPGWVGYIAVPDVDAGAKKVVSLGGKVLREPTDIPNIGRFAAVADPQGVVFHLFKGAGDLSPVAASMKAGHIGWHELHTGDAVKGFAFYNTMFGWTEHHQFSMGDMGTYRIFAIGGTAAGGMFNSPIPTKLWMYYFAVDDIDAALQRITANGGKLMHGPSEVPGGIFIVQATDPQGAVFAVVGMRNKK